MRVELGQSCSLLADQAYFHSDQAQSLS
jgi:hypothetical protein